MKKQTIENKINEICANFVRVKHRFSAYIRDEDTRCENCNGYNKSCEEYKQYGNCQIPLRQGIVFLRIYGNDKS